MSEPITEFTTLIPLWKPRVTPVDLDKATEEQLEAMKVTPSDTGVGDYVLVLAHDPKTLKERTPLFNGIMYSHGGLARAETELGAVAASMVNRCIYCAAVHSNRYNQLTNHEPEPFGMLRVVPAPCSPFSVTEDILRQSAAVCQLARVEWRSKLHDD